MTMAGGEGKLLLPSSSDEGEDRAKRLAGGLQLRVIGGSGVLPSLQQCREELLVFTLITLSHQCKISY